MNTILFLCQHGGAKSVIAASYFNQLARERGLAFAGAAAASEEPYDAVPPPVAGLLARDGFDVSAFHPRPATPADLESAARVISIDCDPAAIAGGGLAVERWDDVPKVSDDLQGSAEAIRRHVETLVTELHVRG